MCVLVTCMAMLPPSSSTTPSYVGCRRLDSRTLLGPVALALVMLIQTGVRRAAPFLLGIVAGRVTHGILTQIDFDSLVRPMHFADPLRRNQDFLTAPPVTCLHDKVAYGPGCFVDEKVGDVSDFTVACHQLVAGNRLAAAQVRVIVVASDLFNACVGFHLT